MAYIGENMPGRKQNAPWYLRGKSVKKVQRIKKKNKDRKELLGYNDNESVENVLEVKLWDIFLQVFPAMDHWEKFCLGG